MEMRALLSQHSVAEFQSFISLGQEHGRREAVLSMVDGAINKLRKDYRFVGGDKPHIERSFFVRQVKNLGSHDFHERLISVVIIALCCISVVGTIFIIVAIPMHLHYFAIEKKLDSLNKHKKSLQSALEKADQLLKRENPQLTFSQGLHSQLPHPHPHPHVGILKHDKKRAHLSHRTGSVSEAPVKGDVSSVKGAQFPDFQEFYKVIRLKIPPAHPSQSNSYFKSGVRSDGQDTDDFIVEKIVERAIKEGGADHQLVIENPLMRYPFEKKGDFPNGVILHVYHEKGEGGVPSLHIWYPDKADRQNLAKYSILRVDLVEKKKGEVRIVTSADIQELYRYMNEPHQTKGASVAQPPPTANPAGGIGGMAVPK